MFVGSGGGGVEMQKWSQLLLVRLLDGELNI